MKSKISLIVTSLTFMAIDAIHAPILFAMPPSGEGKGGGSSILFPIMLSFVVVYFLMIRPQQKREKNFQEKLKTIEKGDEVITKGGLIGKVTNVAEKVLTLEISDKTRVKIDRTFVHVVNKPKT